ncbi:MAG: AIR carboxylase family protein [Betaproteobacteria bacterium]|nr:MAG: AIR carboxylase family protein [Betaproteobacteria bacterium]
MPRVESGPQVGIVMGSDSDWDIMQHAAEQLTAFGVTHEAKVLSAHAAHLAGVIAAKTMLPVLGVPVPSKYLRGEDSLFSTVQMPRGVPVATFAIGEAGAANAALFAVAMLARGDPRLEKKLADFRARQTATLRGKSLPPRKK